MSASTTQIEKQVKRHRGPLYGMALAVVWAAMLFGGFLGWTAYQADNQTAQSPVKYVSD